MSDLKEIKLGEEVIKIIKQLHERDVEETEKDILYTIMALVSLRDANTKTWVSSDWSKYFQTMKALSYLLRSSMQRKKKNKETQTENSNDEQEVFTPAMLAMRQIGNVQPKWQKPDEEQEKKKQKKKKNKRKF